MKRFIPNAHGGVDMYLDDGDTYIRLDAEDLKAIFEVQQKQNDVDFVKHQVWNWVEKQLEGDEFFFADFNSHLFSGDEISKEEIVQKILSDEGLIQKIAEEFRDILEDPATEEGCQEWWYADEAISTLTSIKGVMGEILCDKYNKELLVGPWRVLVIEKGDLCGAENRVPWDDEEPLVEFYDMRADKEKFPEGQFTTGRFYINKLFNPGYFDESIDDMVEQNKGFSWRLDRPECTIGPGELNVISAWLKAVYTKSQEKTLVADLISDASVRVVSAASNDKEQDYLKY